MSAARATEDAIGTGLSFNSKPPAAAEGAAFAGAATVQAWLTAQAHRHSLFECDPRLSEQPSRRLRVAAPSMEFDTRRLCFRLGEGDDRNRQARPCAANGPRKRAGKPQPRRPRRQFNPDDAQ